MDITNKVESFLIEKIEKNKALEVLENIRLGLTYNRFDLAFKLLYIDGISRGKHLDFEKNYYKQHIKAFSLGSFSEPGDSKKNTILDYENTFSNLYLAIKNKGFDKEKSLIPLARDGSILNGAHRTAIAIYLKKQVSAIKTHLPPLQYEYRYFKNRGVPDKILDTVALKYLDYSSNCFLAIIWPAAVGHENDIESLIDEIIYKKEIKLNYLGAHNLLSEAYQDEPWLGSSADNYPGIEHKLTACFPTFNKIKVYIFHRKTLDETLVLKENIRKLFNIGKHAIHITDTHEETKRIGHLLLNENGIHFLNNAHPYKYKTTASKITIFKNGINKKKLDCNNYLLTSSMTMAVYGLRAASDIAYLGEPQSLINDKNLYFHGKNSSYYRISEERLITNQDYHFLFRGVKFINLFELYAMKSNRNKEEDIADSLLIKELIENKRLSAYIKKIKYNIIFIKSKLRIKIIAFVKQFTKKLHIYPYAEKMYRRYKQS